MNDAASRPCPIDIDSLAAIADGDGVLGNLAIVQRRFLKSVVVELREGRAAMATLSADRTIGSVCAALST